MRKKKLKGVKHLIQNNVCAMFINDNGKVIALGFKIRRKKELISVEEFDKSIDQLARSAKTTHRMKMMLMPGLRKEFELAYHAAPTEYPNLTKDRKRRKSSTNRTR